MIKTIFMLLLSLTMFSSMTIAVPGCGSAGCGPRMSFKNQMKERKFLEDLALTKAQDDALSLINRKYVAVMDTLQDKSKKSLEELNKKMHKEMEAKMSPAQQMIFRDYMSFLKSMGR